MGQTNISSSSFKHWFIFKCLLTNRVTKKDLFHVISRLVWMEGWTEPYALDWASLMPASCMDYIKSVLQSSYGLYSILMIAVIIIEPAWWMPQSVYIKQLLQRGNPVWSMLNTILSLLDACKLQSDKLAWCMLSITEPTWCMQHSGEPLECYRVHGEPAYNASYRV